MSAPSGALAVRKGPWKLIPADAPESRRDTKDRAPEKDASGRLFNLADDLGESKNLAGEHPDRVKELSDLLRRIRESGRSRP